MAPRPKARVDTFTYRYHAPPVVLGVVETQLRSFIERLGGSVTIQVRLEPTSPLGAIIEVKGLDIDQELELRKKFPHLNYLGWTGIPLSAEMLKVRKGTEDRVKVRAADENDVDAVLELQKYFAGPDRANREKILARIQANATYVAESKGKIVGEISFTPSDESRASELLDTPAVHVDDHSLFGSDMLWINLAKHKDAPDGTTHLLLRKLLEAVRSMKSRHVVALQVPDATGQIRSKGIFQRLGFIYDEKLHDPAAQRAVLRLPIDISPSRSPGLEQSDAVPDSIVPPWSFIFPIIDHYKRDRTVDDTCEAVYNELLKLGSLDIIYNNIFMMESVLLFSEATRITSAPIRPTSPAPEFHTPPEPQTPAEKESYVRSVIRKLIQLPRKARESGEGYTDLH